MKITIFILILLSSVPSFSSEKKSSGYNVIGFGFYDIEKWINSGTQSDEAISFKYEKRFSRSIYNIGPESEKFFNLKPLVGFEGTSDSASYFLIGVYLEDNLGEIFIDKKSNFIFTPTLSVGYYDEGSGKKLGSNLQIRTSLEISYELKKQNRIAVSYSHTSNANTANKNPGVEILSLSYQIPF